MITNANADNWEKHESHVAAIYRLLGYKVTPNINLAGQQTDLLCERLVPGAGPVRLYVECKYTSDQDQNSVSKDQVNAFVNNFHALKQPQGLSAGVMVSNKRFSQYARAAAAAHPDVYLKTTDDLYSELFNIQPLLRGMRLDLRR